MTSDKSVIRDARVGVVESDARDKTRTVVVKFTHRHPKYGKMMSLRTALAVHDADNVSRRGDVVEIVPCRPVSRTKRWALSRVVERGTGGEEAIGG